MSSVIPNSAPTASGKLLEPVLQLASHYQATDTTAGSLQAEILSAAGLKPADLKHPDTRFPAEHFTGILNRLSKASKDPYIGLRLAEATHPRMLGSLGFLIATAETLLQALQMLEHYLPILSENLTLQLETAATTTRLILTVTPDAPGMTEYFIACLINWPRWLTGQQIPVNHVELALPEPEQPARYRRLLAAEVIFNAPHNSIELSNRDLQRPCTDANREMHQLHKEFADTLLSQSHSRNALTARVRGLIREHLLTRHESVRREEIARQLGMSLRTLQRKLGEQQTNFQTLYDQTRRELCFYLIRKESLSLGEIAFQLGFSNQSAFQKAFKRWTGQPPSHYRRQLQPPSAKADILSPAVAEPPGNEGNITTEDTSFWPALSADENTACYLRLLQARRLRYSNQPQDALILLQQALSPPLPENQQDQLIYLLQKLEQIQALRQPQTVPSHPPNQKQMQQLALLQLISLLAQELAQPLLAACALSEMTCLSLQQPHNPLTRYAYIGYAWVASWFCGDYRLSRDMLQQGMALARPDSCYRDIQSFISVSTLDTDLRHCSQIQHWLQPITCVLRDLELLEKRCRQRDDRLRTGEQQRLWYQLLPLTNRYSLPDLIRQSETDAQQLQPHHPGLAQQIRIYGSTLCRYLQGEQPLPYEARYTGAADAAILIRAALLLDARHLWPDLLHWQTQLENALPGYFLITETLFCLGMMQRLLAQQDSTVSRHQRRTMEQTESRFELWAQHCPENFSAQWWLLKAERLRLQSDEASEKAAVTWFEQAIQHLQTTELRPLQAFALERYAHCLHHQQKPVSADLCRKEATRLYQQWGASALPASFADSV